MSATILIVEDEASVSEMLGILLAQDGYETVFCDTGDKAFETFKTYQPDLVLLDLMLPGKDGIEVCTEIRRESGVPIIMLTAKTESEDVVAGLEAGADDYVAKPCNSAEFLARIRARLRPRELASQETLSIGGLKVDLAGHTVTRDGALIALTPLEFDLLANLASQPGQVMSRETLLDKVWGSGRSVDPRLVNVHIQRLRSKIEVDPENPQIVVTVRGVGYKAVSDKPRR